MNGAVMQRLLRWESLLAAVLVAEFVLFASISPYFLDVHTLSDASFNFTERASRLPLALLSSPARSTYPGLHHCVSFDPWSDRSTGQNGVIVARVCAPDSGRHDHACWTIGRVPSIGRPSERYLVSRGRHTPCSVPAC